MGWTRLIVRSPSDGASRAARRGLSILLPALLLCAASLGGGPARRAVAADDTAKASYRVVDVSLVYVGNPRLFKKPCVVDADRVYRAIPEYAEILEKNLTDRDVRYHFLLRKASEKFARAVAAVAKAGEYDLVAAVGAVVPATADAPAVPNATDATIAKLPV
jgi:hypothetical protein